MSVFADREPLITDVCVPLSSLPQLIYDSRLELSKSGLPSPIVAHAGMYVYIYKLCMFICHEIRSYYLYVIL
jgi:hypothetical protein